jgi:hypothetical protein
VKRLFHPNSKLFVAPKPEENLRNEEKELIGKKQRKDEARKYKVEVIIISMF